MAVTMRDVAKVAGVSVKTVSNVVNDFPHVAPPTRARVRAAIESLGYEMNLTARNLSLGRTGMITLAVPELGLPYFAELSDEVIDAAAEHGYTVLIEQTGGVRERELEVLAAARRRMTDGLIFSPVALRAADAPTLEVDFPMVLLGERNLHGRLPHVAMANVDGARAVADHLLDLGRRRIAVIGSYESTDIGAGALRVRGTVEALRARGVDLVPGLVRGSGGWTRRSGAAAMREVLDGGEPFDAVVGLNDALALGAMRVLHERGLSVPDKVAVAGFDDIDEGRYARPSLTTVHPGRGRIARHALELLVRRVQGDPGVEGIELVVGCELKVRESTAGGTTPVET